MSEMSKKEMKEMRKIEEAKRMNLEKKANMIKWVVIGVISSVFLGFFLFLLFTLKTMNSKATDPNTATEAVSLSDSGEFRIASGSTTPIDQRPVTIVEFADIQCPACQQYHPIVKSVLDLYPETVALNFKHFPIIALHPNAVKSAVAAEAAGNQEKFFEMVDLLYENQEAWANLPDPTPKFVEYATSLKLDINKFKSDLNDKALEQEIDDQRTEGINAGVNATPSFYVNGVKIQNPADISGFQSAIDAELAKVGGDASVIEDEATPSADQSLSPQINL